MRLRGRRLLGCFAEWLRPSASNRMPQVAAQPAARAGLQHPLACSVLAAWFAPAQRQGAIQTLTTYAENKGSR